MKKNILIIAAMTLLNTIGNNQVRLQPSFTDAEGNPVSTEDTTEESYHGKLIKDPYRWLEDENGQDDTGDHE